VSCALNVTSCVLFDFFYGLLVVFSHHVNFILRVPHVFSSSFQLFFNLRVTSSANFFVNINQGTPNKYETKQLQTGTVAAFWKHHLQKKWRPQEKLPKKAQFMLTFYDHTAFITS